jgi:hypothetical protein
MVKHQKFSLNYKDDVLLDLVKKTDHRILAIWAIDCVERVMPFFETKYPGDSRPRQAVATLHQWIDTGVFKMAVIRKASLDSHAAAREVGEDTAARSAARAAGQAVATAHVKTHSLGAEKYVLQAVYRASNPAEADVAVSQERDWHFQRLIQLQKGKTL